MARHRNVNNPRTVSVIVDGNVYDKFIEQLPKKTGTSEAIRNLIEAQVLETEKIKNLNSLDQSAIKSINNKLSRDFKISVQPTLDLFAIERDDISGIIREIERKPMLGKLIGNARAIIKCSQRQIDRL